MIQDEMINAAGLSDYIKSMKCLNFSFYSLFSTFLPFRNFLFQPGKYNIDADTDTKVER